MCGIVGLLSEKKKKKGLVYSTLAQMMPFVEQRGPDSSKIVNLPQMNASIGMTTLAIFNQKSRNGPYSSNDERYHLAYNGEVYNVDQLCKSFEIPLSSDQNDGDMLLYLLQNWGVEALAYVNGMFAIAFVDVNEGTITLAVDQFSQKTLHWSYESGDFQFGSLLSALEGCTLEADAFGERFGWTQCHQNGRTPFRNAHRLKPGSILKYKMGEGVSHSVLPCKVEHDHALSVRDVFSAAIVRTKANSTKTGLLLSGGLDSSILAATVSPDVAFTVSYKEHDAFDEEEKAAEVCRQFGIEHVILRPSYFDLLAKIRNITDSIDYPVGNASILSEYVAYKEMGRHNIRVCFSGVGADELFFGYERMRLFFARATGKVISVSKNYMSLKDKVDRVFNDNDPLAIKYIRLLSRSRCSVYEKLYLLENPNICQLPIPNMMAKIEIDLNLPNLLRTTDAISGYFGVEVRSPYLDAELYSICQDEWVRNGEILDNEVTKPTLREVGRELGLPSSVICDPVKRGFAAPYGLWMSNKSETFYDRKPFVQLMIDTYKEKLIERAQ